MAKTKNTLDLWLDKKGVTPVGKKIYKIAAKVYSKKKLPLSNRDIAEVYESNRTNILAHMRKLIEKGVIKRHSKKFYLVVKP